MKNLYQLYIENDCKFGFYVRRNSWDSRRKAKLIKIEGVVDGEMINGEAPYFSAPYPKGHSKFGKTCYKRECKLVADWFDDGVYKTTSGASYVWKTVK